MDLKTWGCRCCVSNHYKQNSTDKVDWWVVVAKLRVKPHTLVERTDFVSDTSIFQDFTVSVQNPGENEDKRNLHNLVWDCKNCKGQRSGPIPRWDYFTHCHLSLHCALQNVPDYWVVKYFSFQNHVSSEDFVIWVDHLVHESQKQKHNN